MTEPLRILIAADTYPPQLNGAAVAAQRLAHGLAGRGHTVAVVAPNTALNDDERTEGTEGNQLRVYRFKSLSTRPVHPQFRLTLWLGVKARLAQIFEEFRPHIVHLQNHFVLCNGSLKQARSMGIPVVGTNHFMPDNLYEYIPSPLRPAISAIMWGHFLKTYNNLDWVLSPSNACRKILENVGLTRPIRVISNGIDLNRYQPVDTPAGIYERYGIRRDVPLFLTVGRLEKDKKVDLIIKASALARKEANFQTVVVGTGRDEDEFKDLVAKLGLEETVLITGYVPDDDLAHLYRIADVYIGAGAAELQGIAVMEAMANGLPVLAANAMALPELVENGDNGYLFELEPPGLAAKMLMMLKERSRWAEMGARSLALIQPHDALKVLAQVEDLYREAIASAGVSLTR